jgi:alpha-glucosidase
LNHFAKIAQAVRFIGLSNAVHSIKYALQKDIVEIKSATSQLRTDEYSVPGIIRSINIDKNPIEINFGDHTLEIYIFGENSYRITWLPGKLPVPYAIVNSPEAFGDFSVEVHSHQIKVKTDSSSLSVSEEGAITAFNAYNQPVRSEAPPRFFSNGWQHQAELHPFEAVYGLGLRAANLNLRGHHFTAWNTDPGGVYNPGDDPLYFSIPTYIGLSPPGSYLIFYENYHRGEFDFTKFAKARFSDGALQYYLFIDTLPNVLAEYLELTGRPPLPPRWSLGYHQSRWGYKTEAEIRELVDKFQQNDLPLDVVHLDIDYMDGYRVFTIDPDRFPDLPGLSRDLATRDIRLVTIIDPGVKIDSNYRIYQEGLTQSAFLVDTEGTPVKAPVWPGWCAFPDFGQPKTRTWWGKHYAILLNAGISGFWHDMNEPATFPAWGDPTLPGTTMHHLENIRDDHLAGHNLYGLLMNMAGYQALRKLSTDHRPWILSRSGWAGNQRFAWNWTGDVNSSWETLQQIIPIMLNLTLSGQYFSGSDIGGFSAHPDPELYLRWFQLGAMSPFFRLHSATGLPPREPWHFDEFTLGIIRRTLQLRRELMPYLYSLAYLANSCGEPMIRPLFWEDPKNVDFYHIDDQFLLGDHLLIAPVLEPGESSRTVMLPPGEWVDYWNGTPWPGPGPVRILVNFSQIPLFVRAGAVLPLAHQEDLVLRIYLPSLGKLSHVKPTTLYADAGDGYGPSRQDSFKLTSNKKRFKITRKSRGRFSFPYQQILVEILGADISDVHIDGKPVDVLENRILTPLFSRIEFSLAGKHP